MHLFDVQVLLDVDMPVSSVVNLSKGKRNGAVLYLPWKLMLETQGYARDISSSDS